MAKTDLGDKQVCPSCAAKFYDLRKRPAICPKCTTAFDPTEESVRVRRGRSRVAAHDGDYEDDEELAAKKKAEGEEEEEEGAETVVAIDSGAEVDPVLSSDEDEAEPAADELPEGFSEEEADLAAEAVDDDSVPMIEDEEEFPEDAIGEIPSGDEDDGR